MKNVPMPEKANADKYVQLENVDMTFSTKKGEFNALKNINLSIKEGEFISIIGHSGCGNSTVLNLIAGLLQPTNGLLFCAAAKLQARARSVQWYSRITRYYPGSPATKTSIWR